MFGFQKSGGTTPISNTLVSQWAAPIEFRAADMNFDKKIQIGWFISVFFDFALIIGEFQQTWIKT